MNEYLTPGLTYDAGKQLAWLQMISPHFADLPSLPFQWENPLFSHSDAAIWYAVLKHYQPRRIVEVGCGYSTRMALLARSAECEHTAIDVKRTALKPSERKQLRFIQRPAQVLPAETYTGLRAGDVLFIDSSHMADIGGDVEHLILRVLPRLASGVLVHFHDIILPDAYPYYWMQDFGQYFSEQQMLLAFMLHNSRFRLLCAVHYLSTRHGEEMQKIIPFPKPCGGGSWWMEVL